MSEFHHLSDEEDFRDRQKREDLLNKQYRETHLIKPVNDPVNHPSHYTSHPSGIEYIEITRHMNFNLGNVMKYIWRNGLKDDASLQDLEKAAWYLNDEIETRKKKAACKIHHPGERCIPGLNHPSVTLEGR